MPKVVFCNIAWMKFYRGIGIILAVWGVASHVLK